MWDRQPRRQEHLLQVLARQLRDLSRPDEDRIPCPVCHRMLLDPEDPTRLCPLCGKHFDGGCE
jgi:hypothetical protein